MRYYIVIFFALIYSIGYCQYPDGNRKFLMGDFNEQIITNDPTNFSIDTFIDWHYSQHILYTGLNIASIYDSVSQKVLFSNQALVCTTTGDTIQGSEKLLDSLFNDYTNGNGIVANQMQVFLPLGNQRFALIYYSMPDSGFDGIKTQYVFEYTLLKYAEIDMKLNNGKGAVTTIRIIEQDSFLSGHLTATLHANGHDWWILAPHYNNAGYHTYLLTPDSLYTYPTQYIGLPCKAVGKSEFSPQGNKYLMADIWQYAQLFDFDRCTGLLSNSKKINSTVTIAWEYNDSTILPRKLMNWGNGQKTGWVSAAFSPSGRYVYTTSYTALSQYDTEAPQIDTTEKIIAYYDRSYLYAGAEVFYNMFLLNNGKILIGSYGGSPIAGGVYAIHVIHDSDNADTACHFERWGQPLILWASNNPIPQNPHYKTGAVPSAENQQNQTIYYCAGDSITLLRKHYPYSSYKWYDSNTTLATDTLRYALRPTGNKTIYVALHDSTCSCGNRTDTIRFIAVNDTAIYHSYHTTICTTDSIIIGNSYPNSRYAWYRDSTLISTADSITATAAATYIQHIIDTTLLCVTHIDTFYIDTIDCDTIPQLPIGIYFFPNPANDYIEYTINDSSLNINELQLTIVAVSGATVIQKYITNATGKIDITNLASGVYILSLTSDKQVKYRKKWVVW